jgi:surface carbohydrate biosynthesis protein
MGQPRVCLVVDNPLRDLDGMVLLGWTLAQKGAEVFLVPMYQQAFEVAALVPDLVLVNYLRPNNRRLVEAYSKAGILVGILDTEGGVFVSVEKGLTNLVAKSEPSNVDLYCVWGQRQYDSFIEHNILPKENLYITGCPRYDFCAEPWKSALPHLQIDGRPMILVNTRFPVIFPRFQRRLGDEIDIMLKLGFEDSYISESVRQCFLVWAEMINAIAGLAKSFSKAVFVVRPHPFEDRRIYEQVFRDISNVRIIQERSSLPWINSSLLLIQKGCSTALDASFLGVEPVSLEWIDAPMLHNEAVAAVSHPAKSREHLFNIVENALNGNRLSPTPEMKKQRQQIISNWFYAIDGKSSERVANAVLETINKRGNNRAKRNPAKIITHNGLTKAGLKNFANFLGTRTLGFRKYDKLKSHLLRKPRAISKEFSLKDVRSITDSLSKIGVDFKAVKVENVRNEHCYLKMVAHCSIRLST